MPLLSRLARSWLLARIFGGRPRGYGRRGYGRGRASGGLFPFPHYSTRTRRGTRVSVSGCCLPLPLALTLGLVGAIRAVVRS